MNSSAAKLFLTLLWLVPGIGLLIHDLATGQPVAVPMGRWHLPFGWVCLLLAAFNFLRWWSMRSPANVPAGLSDHRRRRKPAPEPDPTFQFDEPPQPPGREA